MQNHSGVDSVALGQCNSSFPHLWDLGPRGQYLSRQLNSALNKSNKPSEAYYTQDALASQLANSKHWLTLRLSSNYCHN